jgi:hypothetical protein
MTRRYPAWRQALGEAAVALAALLVLAAVVLGPRIAHGGLFSDDWNNYMIYTWEQPGGLFDAVSRSAELNSYRPFLVLYVPATVRVFGDNSHLFLAWAALLACLMSTSFFLLLRTLGMERLHAGVLAALLLVFPISASTRLWATASHPALAVATCFLGLAIAIRGLRLTGWRAVATHALAVGLYLVSLWNHELIAPAVLASVLLYRLFVPWPPALRRYVFDFAAVVLTLGLITSKGTNPAQAQTLAEIVKHGFDVSYQAALAVAASTLPFLPATLAVAIFPVLILALALLVVRLPAGDPAREPALRWSLIAAGGLIAMAVAYSIFIPGPNVAFNEPLALGFGQRTSLLAGAGIVVFVYAALQLSTVFLARGRSWWPRHGTFAAIAAIVLIGGGYTYRLEQNAQAWDRAEAIQKDVLAAIKARLPQPLPSGSTVFAGGYPTYSAPDVPAFALYDDLNGAIKAAYDDGTISAFPIVAPRRKYRNARVATRHATRFFCGRTSFTASNAVRLGKSYNDTVQVRVPYGKGFFLNVRTGTVLRPRSRRACEAAAQATPAGPLRASLEPRWPQPGWWSL